MRSRAAELPVVPMADRRFQDRLVDNRRVHLQNIPLVRRYWENYRDKQGHWSLKNSLRIVRNLRLYLRELGLRLVGRWGWSRLPSSFLLNNRLRVENTYHRLAMNTYPRHSMSTHWL